MAELAAHPPAPHDARHATSTGISNEKMVMWAFLGSECLLFGALISTYLLYRHKSVSGPTPKRSSRSGKSKSQTKMLTAPTATKEYRM